MLVVMMILLVVTATATFALHTSVVEVRSAGNGRQRMQTRYVAEAALTSAMAMVETSGPGTLQIALDRSTSGTTIRSLAPEEPPMAANRGNFRIEITDFSGAPGIDGQPVSVGAGTESVGPGMAYAPSFVVDVNDSYRFTGVVAGARADGNGSLQYVAATYTARGQTAPASDVYSPTLAGLAPTARRGLHQVVTNARSIGISGPVGR